MAGNTLTIIQSPEVIIGSEVSRSNGYFNPIPYVLQYEYDTFVAVDLNGSNTRITLGAVPGVGQYSAGDRLSIFGGPYDGKEIGIATTPVGAQITVQGIIPGVNQNTIAFRGTGAGVVFNLTKSPLFRVEMRLVEPATAYPLDAGTVTAWFPRIDGKIYIDPSSELQKYLSRIAINYLVDTFYKHPDSKNYILQYRIAQNNALLPANSWLNWPEEWVGNPSEKQLLEPYAQNLFDYSIKECSGGVAVEPQLTNWDLATDLAGWSQVDVGAAWIYNGSRQAAIVTMTDPGAQSSIIFGQSTPIPAAGIGIQVYLSWIQSFADPGVVLGGLQLVGYDNPAGPYTVLTTFNLPAPGLLLNSQLFEFDIPAGPGFANIGFRATKPNAGTFSVYIEHAWKQVNNSFVNDSFIGSIIPWLNFNGTPFTSWFWDNVRNAASAGGAFGAVVPLYQNVGLAKGINTTIDISLERTGSFFAPDVVIEVVGIKYTDFNTAGAAVPVVIQTFNLTQAQVGLVQNFNFVVNLPDYYQALAVRSNGVDSAVCHSFVKSVPGGATCALTPAKWATRRTNLFIYDQNPYPLSFMVESATAARMLTVRESYLDINGNVLFTQSVAINIAIDSSGIYTHIIKPPSSNYEFLSVFIEESASAVTETIRLQNKCVQRNAIFVEWVNSLGGVEVYGFFQKQEVSIQAEKSAAFERAQDDLALASGVAFKNKAENKFSIVLADDFVNKDDVPALHEMKSSNSIRLLNGSLPGGVFVTPVDGASSDYNTRGELTTFTVEFEMPTGYNPVFLIQD